MTARDAFILCPTTLASLAGCLSLLLFLSMPAFDRRTASWILPPPALPRESLHAAPPGEAAAAAAPLEDWGKDAEPQAGGPKAAAGAATVAAARPLEDQGKRAQPKAVGPKLDAPGARQPQELAGHAANAAAEAAVVSGPVVRQKFKPNCTPTKASTRPWNTCTSTSLSTTMCREPVGHPPVKFFPARCGDDTLCLYLTPTRVDIKHNGRSFDEDRKCASAEIFSLALPLIYKDGWPLKTRKNVSMEIAYNDIGECVAMSYVLGCEGRSPPIPDSAFWGRPDTFFPNYTQAVIDLKERSKKAPTIRKCIWAGNPEMHPKRAFFLKAAKNFTDLIDVHLVHGHWGLEPKLKAKALPLTEQIEKWACMVDIQGGGFSGRVPLLLSSGRPLMVVQRKKAQDFDKMFYYWGIMPERLEPWVHYVPVAHDYHDLGEAARWILQPANAEKLVRNAMAYAAKYLTLDYAVQYTAKAAIRAMKVIELEDARKEKRRKEEAARKAALAAANKTSTARAGSTVAKPSRLNSKAAAAAAAVAKPLASRPGCKPRGASEKVWNSCTPDSLSSTMCLEPSGSPSRPEVLFGPGRCRDSTICLEFTPRRVRITHDGTGGNGDRKCATAEMASLAVPLIYKAGWPLKRRQNVTLSISLRDIGDCLVNFSYVLGCGGTSPPLPDSAFWGRPDTFFPNYTEAVRQFQALSRKPPAQRKCIWAGNPDMHPKRGLFAGAAAKLKDLIDLNLVHGHWGLEPKLKKAAMPLAQQVERWACLIDVQGGGFSGRVPLLMSSGRPLMVVRRKKNQDLDQMFYTVGSVPEKPQPWVHYVPVAEDLSDLAQSARWILEPENGQRIARNAMLYAAKYLTLDYAVRYTSEELLRALRFVDETDGKQRLPTFAH